jgi:hypothetical protein
MATSVTLTPRTKTVAVGKNLKLKAKVSAAQSKDHPAGTVAFYVNGQLVATKTVSHAGKASDTYKVTLPISATGYPVKAVFTSSSADFAEGTSATGTLKVKK